MFAGNLSVSMDSKGRFAIPTRFREGLVPEGMSRLAMTIDPNYKNLVLYPLAHWGEIQEKIAALPSLNPHAKRLQQLVIGHAFDDLEPDSGGRILVPPSLRKYAQLEKKLVLLGQPRKIEIWSESLWEERCESLINSTLDPQTMPEQVEAIPL